MILELLVPQIDGRIDRVKIDKLEISVGDSVAVSDSLLEFTAGLDYADMHGCPPTTRFRMNSGETAYVRQISVQEDARPYSGEVLAILSTEPDEPINSEERRKARHSLAAIFSSSAW